MPVLYCRHLDKRTQWKVVTGDSFTLGFSSSASVPVPDERLAPREVSVSRAGDRYVLRDLVERGRVFLNGMAAREGLLEDGDRVQVGRISILFLDDARAHGGEVDLFPREAGPEADAKRWESLEAEGDRGAKPAALPAVVEARSTAFLACLAISLVLGFAIGLLVIRPPPNRASRAGVKGVENASPAGEIDVQEGRGARDAEPAGVRQDAPSPGEGSQPESPKPTGDAGLRRLDEIRRLTEEGERPDAPPAVVAGEPARASARVDPEKQGLQGSPLPAPAIVPAHPSPGEAVSRLVLFRLFLDVAGRPPTREEERAILPLPHEEKFRRAVEVARREGSPEPSASIASLFQLWIGRPPLPDESRKIAAASSPERPPAFWISALPDYAKFERRRPRSVRQRARSLIVDLLDRPPSDEAEVDLIEAALREPRSLEDLARTLVHSPESRLGEEWEWEAEFFRFFLRAPAPAERVEIERVLEGLPAGAARRYLALALVSFPEYRSY